MWNGLLYLEYPMEPIHDSLAAVGGRWCTHTESVRVRRSRSKHCNSIVLVRAVWTSQEQGIALFVPSGHVNSVIFSSPGRRHVHVIHHGGVLAHFHCVNLSVLLILCSVECCNSVNAFSSNDALSSRFSSDAYLDVRWRGRLKRWRRHRRWSSRWLSIDVYLHVRHAL